MSSPADPHDPRFDLEREDHIVLLALGEPVEPEFTDHARTCDRCQRELAAYRHTAELAREATHHREFSTATPPPSVWAAIEAEVARDRLAGTSQSDISTGAAGTSGSAGSFDSTAAAGSTGAAGSTAAADTTGPAGADVTNGPRRAGASDGSAEPPRVLRGGRGSRSWSRPTLLLAAAAVVILIAGFGGFLVGRSTSSSDQRHTTSAALVPQPGGPSAATGSATIRAVGEARQLTVHTEGLPSRAGYYEVWLYDPQANNMVAVGALGTGGTGTYTLPAGIDLTDYHVVDVSAQDYTGGSVITHAASVLRGQLD